MYNGELDINLRLWQLTIETIKPIDIKTNIEVNDVADLEADVDKETIETIIDKKYIRISKDHRQ